jgi:hypothetical protein
MLDDDEDGFKQRAWAAERGRDKDREWRDRTERLIRSAEAKARNPKLHLDVDDPADWQVEALVKAGCWPRKRTQAEREWAGVPVLEQRHVPVKRQDEIVFRPKHLRAV